MGKIRQAATAVDHAADEVAETADAYEDGVTIRLGKASLVLDWAMGKIDHLDIDIIPRKQTKP